MYYSFKSFKIKDNPNISRNIIFILIFERDIILMKKKYFGQACYIFVLVCPLLEITVGKIYDSIYLCMHVLYESECI